jgi:hypothetical protein
MGLRSHRNPPCSCARDMFLHIGHVPAGDDAHAQNRKAIPDHRRRIAKGHGNYVGCPGPSTNAPVAKPDCRSSWLDELLQDHLLNLVAPIIELSIALQRPNARAALGLPN